MRNILKKVLKKVFFINRAKSYAIKIVLDILHITVICIGACSYVLMYYMILSFMMQTRTVIRQTMGKMLLLSHTSFPLVFYLWHPYWLSYFSPISWQEYVTFWWDDNDVRFVLDQTLSWIFIVLAHWTNSSRIDMSLHLDTLFWFTTKQCFLLLLSAGILNGEATITNIIVFGLTRLGFETTFYRIRGVHADHYTTDWFGAEGRLTICQYR